MSANEYDKMFEHAHDGITADDNPAPAWFTWLFVLSIFVSGAYIAYYHLGAGPSVNDRYEADAVVHTEKLLAALGAVQPDNETIVRLMHDDDWMSAMSGVFVGNCGQCHANDGGGNIGPNLTDDYYKIVTEPADFFTVISDGVAGAAMSPWKDRLGEPQIILLAAYVASLRGTAPVVAKEREGDRADPWPALAPSAPSDEEPAADEDPGA